MDSSDLPHYVKDYYILNHLKYYNLYHNDHLRVLAGMSVNIKYTVALFSTLNVLVRKKQHATCSIFLCILLEIEWPLMLQTSTAITIHQLSFDRLIFRNSLSIRGWYFRKKNKYVSQHTIENCSCIIHVQLAETRPEGHGLVSNK